MKDKIDSKTVQQLERWIYLMQQIFEARHYAERAREIGNPAQFETIGGILEFLVFFRGALSAYAKCFVSSGSGKSTLNKSRIFTAGSTRLSAHEKLMALRHKYLAHSDENEIERTRISIEETESAVVIHLEYQFSFLLDRLYELCDLIKDVEEHIVDRQSKHVKGLEVSLGKTVSIQRGDERVVL